MNRHPTLPRQVASEASTAGRVLRGATLRDRFDPRRNSLTMLRLGLALTVAFVHALAVGFDHQPYIGVFTVGELAVDAFFVLSGFLVTASFLRLSSVRRYAWHRFLRIMPGFWACLLVTAALVAPVVALLSGRPALSVFRGENSAIDYVVANGALLMRQFDIAGLPENVPSPGVFDGSLWTLFYEAVCYGLVLGLGVFGLLRRRKGLVLGLVGALWVVTVLNTLGFEVISQERLLRFTLIFLLGALALLYADRLPMNGYLAIGALAVLVPSLLFLPDYRALAAPAFAYLCLWAVVAVPLRHNPGWDLSYGVYVYHWPIQQLLFLLGVTALGEPLFVLASLVLAAGAATLSWRFIEGPALGLKDAAWVERSWAPRPAWLSGAYPWRRAGRQTPATANADAADPVAPEPAVRAAQPADS